MAASTNKKVLVSRFDREPLAGFINPATWQGEAGPELMTPQGSLAAVPWSDVKMISFVRGFDHGEPRRELRQFASRPKIEGLWVRMRFRDGDSMEGILANNLLQDDRYGFVVVPPDPAFQYGRIFVPRAALSEMQVLGVIGTPLRKAAGKAGTAAAGQLEMFGKR